MEEIGPALKQKFTGIVRFEVTDTGTWTLDLKTGDGAVTTGEGKVKPDLVIKVADEDFASLYEGKSNAQQVCVYCCFLFPLPPSVLPSLPPSCVDVTLRVSHADCVQIVTDKLTSQQVWGLGYFPIPSADVVSLFLAPFRVGN